MKPLKKCHQFFGVQAVLPQTLKKLLNGDAIKVILDRRVSLSHIVYLLISVILLILILSGCDDVENREENIEWTGLYKFEEYTSPNIAMQYTLEIYHEDGQCWADIDIDGFQTQQRLKASVSINENFAEIIFDSYRPENVGEIFEKGDVLLTLQYQNNNLMTEWGELKPSLAENKQAYCYYIKVK